MEDYWKKECKGKSSQYIARYQGWGIIIGGIEDDGWVPLDCLIQNQEQVEGKAQFTQFILLYTLKTEKVWTWLIQLASENASLFLS